MGEPVQILDSQQVTLTVTAEDSKGQPVSDTLTWTVDDAAVVAITPSADGTSVLCVAGSEGTANVTVADDSTPPLTAVESFTVVAGAASSLVITAGDPVAQPAVPPTA